MMKKAPIVLFTYDRLAETVQTVSALENNIGSDQSDIYIYSDAPKGKLTEQRVFAVRKYLRSIKGFKKVTIIEREENYGLAKSIIFGVSEIIEKFGEVIVLEDDLLTSPNFLLYMNQSLKCYRDVSQVWSISGFSFPIDYPQDYSFDSTFGVRASSWGWATWKDRWEKVDWAVSDYGEFCGDYKAQKKFNRGGSDLCKMLSDQMTGRINSWAIRFCYDQFRQNAYDVFPKVSKVANIGFSSEATNTSGMHKRFATPLDNTSQLSFDLPMNIALDESVLRQFQKPFSLVTRLKYKLLGMCK